MTRAHKLRSQMAETRISCNVVHLNLGARRWFYPALQKEEEETAARRRWRGGGQM